MNHCRTSFAALVALACLGACGNSHRPAGELVVAVSSDMNVPKDLSAVIVQIVRAGGAEEPLRFDLGPGRASLPLTMMVPAKAPAPDEVTVRVTGWKGDSLRVIREARTIVPTDRQALLALQLQWLCNEQVRPGATIDAPADAATTCDDGMTCVLGQCRSIAVASDGLRDWDPALVYGGGTGPGTGSCLDMGACFDDAAAIAPRADDCSVDRPSAGAGFNVSLVLPPNRDGFCDGLRCLIPLDGFSTDLGWSEVGGRLSLPPAVCERVADGRLLGVAVSNVCPTKTVSIPICSWRDTPGGRDAGATTPTPPPVRDAGAPDLRASHDAAVIADAPSDGAAPPPPPPPLCSTVDRCLNGDGCCPSACNATTDDDCGPRCGNKVVEGSELCDGDCPTACPQQACRLRKLQASNTCQARCVDDGTQTACRNGDGCCPSACSRANDDDCACVPVTEVCNGKDDDCDGQIDEATKTRYYRDQDGDGYGDPGRTADACSAPAGYVADHSDCDDGTASGHPGAAETCNGRDDDCNGSTDEGVRSTFYRDADGDGHGTAATSAQGCSAPAGYVADKLDCDDARAATFPGAAEACNGIDDNCNGSTDEGVRATFYADVDGDGYGVTATTMQACSAPAGYASANGDCNDARPLVHPGAAERCNVIDDDCDGTIDEDCPAAEVFAFTDNLAALTAQHFMCEPSTAFSDVCYAASNRWCRAHSTFSAGGYGTIDYDGSANYWIVCLNRNLGDYKMLPFATLATFNAACTDNSVGWSFACANAVDLACQNLGYVGGVGPVEHADGGVGAVCVSRGTQMRVAPATLAAQVPACNSAAVAFSGACLSAVHHHCVAAGYATGFGPTSAGGGDGIRFVCVPAL